MDSTPNLFSAQHVLEFVLRHLFKSSGNHTPLGHFNKKTPCIYSISVSECGHVGVTECGKDEGGTTLNTEYSTQYS